MKRIEDIVGFILIIIAKTLLILVANVVKRFCPLNVLYVLLGRIMVELCLCIVSLLISSSLYKENTTTTTATTNIYKRLGNIQFWFGPKKDYWSSCLRGVFYWLFVICYYQGIRMIPFSHASVIMSLHPFIAAWLSYIILKETIPKYFYHSVLISLLGLALSLQLESGTKITHNLLQYSFGVLAIVSAALFTSFQPVLTRYTKDTKILQSVLISSLVAGIVLTPLAILFSNIILQEKSDIMEGMNKIWEYKWILFCIGTLTFIAWALEMIGYRMIASTAYGSLSSFLRLPISLFANACFVQMFDDKLSAAKEQMNWRQYCGVALVVIGCALPTLINKSKKSHQS